MNDHSFFTLYTAGEVQRCHTQRVLVRQSIADHSWGVAMIIIWLYGGKAPSNLLQAALVHDLPEHVTGDTPVTAKWSSAELTEALYTLETEQHVKHGTNYTAACTPEELALLKVADSIELVLYCLTEMRMGNRRVSGMAQNALHVAEDILWAPIGLQLPNRAKLLYDRVKRELEKELGYER